LVRGVPPARAARAAAPRAAPRGPAAEPLPAAVAPALARLVAEPGDDRPRTLALVEVRADGVATARLGTDELGIPVSLEPVRLVDWASLLPWLPPDDDERRLVLAGGIRARGWVGPGVDRVATAPLRLAHQADCTETVLLHRLGGWPIPDRLVRSHQLTHHVPASGPVLDDRLVTELMAVAPLRHDYGLVLIDLDNRGTTRPVPHPLFPGGQPAGNGSVVTVPVTAPSTRRQPVVVAVVTGPAGTPARQC